MLETLIQIQNHSRESSRVWFILLLRGGLSTSNVDYYPIYIHEQWGNSIISTKVIRVPTWMFQPLWIFLQSQFTYKIYDPTIKRNKICWLQLRRSHTGHLDFYQLTGGWQYDGIMWSALCSLKSNNITFFQSSSYPTVLMRLRWPRSVPKTF